MTKGKTDAVAATEVLPPETGVSATKLGESRYAELLKGVCEKVSETVKHNLQFYWELGKVAAELREKPGNYGNKTIENLATDVVKSTGVSSLGAQSIYKAITFYTNINSQHLTQLQAKNVSWRNAARLADGRMKPEQRESMISEIVSGKLAQDKVPEAIKTKLNLPSRTAGKKTPRPMAQLKSMSGLFEMVEGKIAGFGNSARETFRGDDLDNMKKARELIIEARDAFDSINVKWAKELKQAEEELAKVEAQLVAKKPAKK